MIAKLKELWGAGAPKGFKFAAWGVAIGVFAVWQYRDSLGNNGQFSDSARDEWNKKIKSKTAEK